MDDPDAIRAATATLLDAVNSSDVERVMSVWAEDGVMMPPHRPSVRGTQEIEAYFRRLFESSRFRFAFTSSEVRVDGDTAAERVEYVAEAWIGNAAEPVTDGGKGLHVYTRRSGVWKLSYDIWNSDRPVRA